VLTGIGVLGPSKDAGSTILCGLKVNSERNNKMESEVSKECIFTTIASEAAGLYNLLITVSMGVFAGTLLFLDRIAPSPTRKSLWFLALGWLMLLLCTLACAWVRWKNLESGRLALEGKFEDARKVDKPNRNLTKFAILSLAFGITFIGIFALMNIVNKASIIERNIKMVEEKQKNEHGDSNEDLIEKAIPFSSTNPSEEEQVQGNNQDSSGDAQDEGVDEAGENSVDNQ